MNDVPNLVSKELKPNGKHKYGYSNFVKISVMHEKNFAMSPRHLENLDL